uniref:Uncharacterized protein n=1 Tax=Anguilla anguilla TaxID=7936 RepID=A0A0E9VW48_ANGAN
MQCWCKTNVFPARHQMLQ